MVKLKTLFERVLSRKKNTENNQQQQSQHEEESAPSPTSEPVQDVDQPQPDHSDSPSSSSSPSISEQGRTRKGKSGLFRLSSRKLSSRDSLSSPGSDASPDRPISRRGTFMGRTKSIWLPHLPGLSGSRSSTSSTPRSSPAHSRNVSYSSSGGGGGGVSPSTMAPPSPTSLSVPPNLLSSPAPESPTPPPQPSSSSFFSGPVQAGASSDAQQKPPETKKAPPPPPPPQSAKRTLAVPGGNPSPGLPIAIFSGKGLKQVPMDELFPEQTLASGEKVRIGRAEIQTLRLGNNQITELPKEIGLLTNMKILDLSFNLLSNLPVAELSKLTKLREVQINGNQLFRCGDELFSIQVAEALSDVTLLDLAQNKISGKMLHSICFLRSLRELNLSHNSIESLPLEIGLLGPSLRILNLKNNCLVTLPQEISSLVNLDELNLENNQLTQLPENVFGKLTLLRILSLANNQLSTLPTDMHDLCALTTLNLSSNKLSSLASFFTSGDSKDSSLEGLRQFDASCNKIESVPLRLFRLEALRKLNLSRNCISTLRITCNEEEDANCQYWSLPRLEELNLAGNQIPLDDFYFLFREKAVFEALSRLGILNLSCNDTTTGDLSVRSLPNEMTRLCYLREFDVGFMGLQTLFDGEVVAPPAVEKHEDNNDSSFDDVEPEPTFFDSIRELFLSGNQLQALPGQVAFMSNLNDLYLSENTISEIDSANSAISLSIRQLLLDTNPVNQQQPVLEQLIEQESSSNSSEYNFEREFLLNIDFTPYFNQTRTQITRSKFGVTFAEMRGKRPTMEDAWHLGGKLDIPESDGIGYEFELFALFDGHAGKKSAQFAAQTLPEVIQNKIRSHFSEQKAKESEDSEKSKTMDEQTMLSTIINKSLEESFVEVDGLLRQKLNQDSNQSQGGKLSMQSMLEKHSGSTAVCALIVSPVASDRHMLFVANVGDSRAVLGKYVAGDQVEAHRLSIDHKPLCPEEEERIRRAGGYVTDNGRVNGNLAVARSLGDYYLYPMVISEPYIAPLETVHTRSTTEETTTERKSDFLIIACDGIFDVVDDQLACNTVAEELTKSGGQHGELACARLRDLAFSFGSDDNISVILIQF